MFVIVKMGLGGLSILDSSEPTKAGATKKAQQLAKDCNEPVIVLGALSKFQRKVEVSAEHYEAA